MAAARAGAVVRMIGTLGDDADGRALFAQLKSDRIDCTAVEMDRERSTGRAYVLVDRLGENQIITIVGANAAAHRLPETNERILLAQLEVPLQRVAAFLSRPRKDTLAILNAAPFHLEADYLIGLADIIVVNEIELAGFCGADASPKSTTQAEEMASGLRSHEQQTIIVTRGSLGSIAVGPDGVLVTPAAPAQVIDTTGAGDCFCGFLAAGLATGLPISASIKRAHQAAAIAVARNGASSSIPFAAELDEIPIGLK
jgi:ribokinase